MESAFFVLITYCGWFSCDEPKQIKFDNESACVEFVQAVERNSSSSATCFDRKTGKVVADTKGRR